MYFSSEMLFNARWLFDDPVNGPIMYNEQIEEDAWDAVWEAGEKHWNAYGRLYNPVVELADEFESEYEYAQWRMEFKAEEKFGFGAAIKI